MPDELIEALNALSQARAAEAALAVEVPAQPPGHDMVVPEQLPAADAAFAEEGAEANAVVAWLSMWGGSLLLNDVAKDAAESDDERRNKRQPKRRNCC